ncbi:hypothetical protein Taro_053009, partial [Colocasia esculenta]|nr:hypothetical protein [Colocasia esculenta]
MLNAIGRYVAFRSEGDTLVVATSWRQGFPGGVPCVPVSAGLSWLQLAVSFACGGCPVYSLSPGAWHLRACPVQRLSPFFWDPYPREPVEGVFQATNVLELVGRRVGVGPQLGWAVVTLDRWFSKLFFGAVCGGTVGCSSLTSWSVRGLECFCLWALDLVEVCAEDCFRIVFDSAGSAGVVSGLTLVFLLLWLVASFPVGSEYELQKSVATIAGCTCYERCCWFARAAVGFVIGIRIRVGYPCRVLPSGRDWVLVAFWLWCLLDAGLLTYLGVLPSDAERDRSIRRVQIRRRHPGHRDLVATGGVPCVLVPASLLWLQPTVSFACGGCLACSLSPDAWHLRACTVQRLSPFSWDPHPREPVEGVLRATSVLELAALLADSRAERKTVVGSGIEEVVGRSQRLASWRRGQCVLLLAACGGGLVALVVTVVFTSFLSSSSPRVHAEGCFRIVFDSAGSAVAVSGPTLVVSRGITLFHCLVVLCSRALFARFTPYSFQEWFAAVKVKLCGNKVVDIEDIEKHGMHSIMEAIQRMKWLRLVIVSEPSYLDLAKAFYTCLKTEEDGSLCSSVKEMIWDRKNKLNVSLPYADLLSRIFKEYDIDLKGEVMEKMGQPICSRNLQKSGFSLVGSTWTKTFVAEGEVVIGEAPEIPVVLGTVAHIEGEQEEPHEEIIPNIPAEDVLIEGTQETVIPEVVATGHSEDVQMEDAPFQGEPVIQEEANVQGESTVNAPADKFQEGLVEDVSDDIVKPAVSSGKKGKGSTGVKEFGAVKAEHQGMK